MTEKPDTFTLHKTGHFHFALTKSKFQMTNYMIYAKEQSYQNKNKLDIQSFDIDLAFGF